MDCAEATEGVQVACIKYPYGAQFQLSHTFTVKNFKLKNKD